MSLSLSCVDRKRLRETSVSGVPDTYGQIGVGPQYPVSSVVLLVRYATGPCVSSRLRTRRQRKIRT